ncbi:MAG: glycosyltransferase family 39 protein, partial [Flavobacteriales bacterium]
MTWNYAFTDANFFHPRMCNLHADQNTAGYTAAEFPVIYWGVGMLWRLIGQSEFAFRLIMLLIHFAGSYALYLLASRITRSTFWGIWTSLLFFTSPATVYFAISFLPDVPAFDLGLIGCWWFYRYFTERRRALLILALAFTSLAMLLKVTAGFFFIALWGVLVLETLGIGRKRSPWRLFPRPRAVWPWFLATLIPVVLWYAYSQHYNDVHESPFTQTGLSPFWKMSDVKIAHAFHEAWTIVLYEIFDAPVWFMFIGLFVLMAYSVKSFPWQVIALQAMLLFGFVLYLMGWTLALDDHDYYFICPQIILVTLLIAVLWRYGPPGSNITRSPWIRCAAAIMLGWSVFYASMDMDLRTRNGAEV